MAVAQMDTTSLDSSQRGIPGFCTIFPLELLFGRKPRGVLDLLKEGREGLESKPQQPAHMIADLNECLKKMSKLAQEALGKGQQWQKERDDIKVLVREFQMEQKVLPLFPVSENKLSQRWQGPYEVV